MLFYLFVGHFLMDYPLQGDAMAIEKSRHSKSPLQKAVPWYYWLTGHALLHGGAVAFVTGSIGFGILETVCHWIIDFAKCEGWTNIHIDQALHILCKIGWWLLIINGVTLNVDPAFVLIRRA